MALAINTVTHLPITPNTAYVVTRPAGCIPASSNFDTNTHSFDTLDLSPVGAGFKGISLRITPVCPPGTHVGVAINPSGNQPCTPAVFGAGVGLWTHANGFYFDGDGGIYAETWHVNPGTSQASGAWLDVLRVGDWVAGHTYQVDVSTYNDGYYTCRILDLQYRLDTTQANPNAMPKFFTTNASPTDPSIPIRIKAKSVFGRTSKLAVFNAGSGSSLDVQPIAIFN